MFVFLGEGENTSNTRKELKKYANKAKKLGLKTCLYSGRDIEIEKWMNIFDFVKVGSYKKEFGSLFSETTNQKFYKKTTKGFIDITNIFWMKA